MIGTDYPLLAFPRISKYYKIPEARIEYFVPRDNIIQTIRRYHQLPDTVVLAKTVVLYGIGGCGKSQLALEYCRQCREASFFDRIVWLDASSRDSIILSYSAVAEGILPKEMRPTNKRACVQMILDIIESWTGPWLLVLDNFGGSQPFTHNSILNFLPQGSSGCYLFTTRHGAARSLGHPIQVSRLSEEEGLQLLFSKRRGESKRQMSVTDGSVIIQKLDFLALAVDLAGAYIWKSHADLRTYIERDEISRASVLQRHSDSWDSQNSIAEYGSDELISVYTACEMSFSQLSSYSEGSRNDRLFFTLLAFLDGREILEELFRVGQLSDRWSWTKWFCEDEFGHRKSLKTVVAIFHELSLLQSANYGLAGPLFTIHPLVQQWMRSRLRRSEYQGCITAAKDILYRYITSKESNQRSFEAHQATVYHLHSIIENEKRIGLSRDGSRIDTVFAKFIQKHRMPVEQVRRIGSGRTYCYYCDKKFFRQSDLEHHMRKHQRATKS